MCVLILPTTFFSETFVVLRKTEREISKNVYWSWCRISVIAVGFWWKVNFLDRFSKNTQISNLMKVRPVAAELFHADGRTDNMTMLMVAFRSFVKSCPDISIFFLPKICEHSFSSSYSIETHRGTLLVVQLVEALRYKWEGCGFDSRWCHWNFSLT